jgi:hypothetical protein
VKRETECAGVFPLSTGVEKVRWQYGHTVYNRRKRGGGANKIVGLFKGLVQRKLTGVETWLK